MTTTTEEPPPTRRRRRAVVGLLVLLVVALGAVVALLVLDDPEPPAGAPWSIATEPGAVVVDISRTTDASGLESALARVGVPAQVDFLGSDRHCQADRYAAVASLARGSVSTLEIGLHVLVTIDRDDLAGGRTLVLEASLTDVPFGALGFATGPVAPCVPVPLSQS